MAIAPKTPVPMVMVDLPFHDLRHLTIQNYPGVSFEEWLIHRTYFV
jgi:hypothetical protein